MPDPSLETALRLTEILMALAFAQQSVEHLAGFADARRIHLPRLILAACLLAGWQSGWVLVGLCLCGIAHLWRFQGPYNGGSDRMSLLILACVTAAHWLPPRGAELAFAYLGAQLTLSYVMAGWVKLRNPDWRSGQALVDVFAFSAYPVSESLRGWQHRRALLRLAGWGVIALELAFPLALFDARWLGAMLVCTAAFHLSNAMFFGLNRFFWIWITAYPALIWLQARLG